MAFGRYFEEFEVGEVMKHWPGRTILEADNTWFSLLTMNQHPLHIDAHYASQTQHRQRLVVGTLVFSIVVGMSVSDISGRAIANLEYEEVKHVGTCFSWGHDLCGKPNSRTNGSRGQNRIVASCTLRHTG